MLSTLFLHCTGANDEEKTEQYERHYHGRLARRIKCSACDVGEAKEGLDNELWRR